MEFLRLDCGVVGTLPIVFCHAQRSERRINAFTSLETDIENVYISSSKGE